MQNQLRMALIGSTTVKIVLLTEDILTSSTGSIIPISRELLKAFEDFDAEFSMPTSPDHRIRSAGSAMTGCSYKRFAETSAISRYHRRPCNHDLAVKCEITYLHPVPGEG